MDKSIYLHSLPLNLPVAVKSVVHKNIKCTLVHTMRNTCNTHTLHMYLRHKVHICMLFTKSYMYAVHKVIYIYGNTHVIACTCIPSWYSLHSSMQVYIIMFHASIYVYDFEKIFHEIRICHITFVYSTSHLYAVHKIHACSTWSHRSM